MSAADPAGLNLRPISRVLARVLIVSLLSTQAIETAAQVVDLPRFRIVQVLDEPVIDLDDPFPEDPRYNTIAVADDLNRDGLLDVIGLVAEGQQIHVALNVGDAPTPTAAPTDPAGSPTPTPTDSQPTETPTETPTEAPTAAPPTPAPTLPLATASATNSPTRRPASSDDDACAIVAPGASSAGWPLALGCVFIVAVRRHRWRSRR